MTQLVPGNSLGFLLTDISRLFRQAFERAVDEAGIGLTPGEVRALAHVARFPGSRQAILADRMGVEPMTLSAYLDRLEAHGLILRATDPKDRRAKVINLAEGAAEAFDQIKPLALDLYTHTTRGIDPDVLRMVEEALWKMRANLTNEQGYAAGYPTAAADAAAAAAGAGAAGL